MGRLDALLDNLAAKLAAALVSQLEARLRASRRPCRVCPAIEAHVLEGPETERTCDAFLCTGSPLGVCDAECAPATLRSRTGLEPRPAVAATGTRTSRLSVCQ